MSKASLATSDLGRDGDICATTANTIASLGNYLRDGDNRNLRDVARLVDTVIGEHLAHLRTLERLLQG